MSDLLHEIGGALYGPLWQSEMARDLGVAIRTVQRWAAGTYPVPEGVWWDLRDRIDVRRGELVRLFDKLPRRPRRKRSDPLP